jgi:predicted DsbA family dithiol-disulfide isomerase
MSLETLSPAADWDPAAHAEAVDTLARLGPADRVLVWCDDGCGDCWALLPAFAAALEAADVDADQVVQYPVERLPEGRKRGPKVEAYGIERIPTVVIERYGVETARFVEGDAGPIAEALARQLGSADRVS